jgi:malonyl-CoA/methylmalonyl-CoA synthetase
VGKPLPGVEARLVDEKRATSVREGRPGEILVRGDAVFKEYWRRDEETRDAFDKGWFRTGDIGVREGGSYRILGRSSVDIIKTGGYKVSALEIEEQLRNHPKISECVVVGIPDLEWGELVGAAVVPESGVSIQLSELREWASGRLAQQKIPSRLVAVEELPRNAMGKVVKPTVKELLMAASEVPGSQPAGGVDPDQGT